MYVYGATHASNRFVASCVCNNITSNIAQVHMRILDVVRARVAVNVKLFVGVVNTCLCTKHAAIHTHTYIYVFIYKEQPSRIINYCKVAVAAA